MELDIKEFIERIEKDLIEEEKRTNDLPGITDNIKIDDLEMEEDVKESTFSLEKEGELTDKKDFYEDIKEEDQELNTILEDLNKNIFINVKEEKEDKNQKACQEILAILGYTRSHKNIREVSSPFKPLLQPRKISMVGRVFYNSAYHDENKTKENTTTFISQNNNGI